MLKYKKGDVVIIRGIRLVPDADVFYGEFSKLSNKIGTIIHCNTGGWDYIVNITPTPTLRSNNWGVNESDIVYIGGDPEVLPLLNL
jgi:hypothetical protein